MIVPYPSARSWREGGAVQVLRKAFTSWNSFAHHARRSYSPPMTNHWTLIRRGVIIHVVVVLFSTLLYAEDGKSVRWVNLENPGYPALARQARIQGQLHIQVHFSGCTMDRNRIRLISGHPMLAAAAVTSVKNSNIECGDYYDSDAVLVYIFQLSQCSGTAVEVTTDGNRVTVRACVAPLPEPPK